MRLKFDWYHWRRRENWRVGITCRQAWVRTFALGLFRIHVLGEFPEDAPKTVEP